MAERIDRLREGYDRHYSTGAYGFLQAHHCIVASMIDEGPVLDLGCGNGHFLELLDRRGIEGEGIELSDVGVQHCIERGLKVRQGNLDEEDVLSSYKDNQFKYVTIIGAIESVVEVVNLLKEAGRIGENVIIAAPNYAYFYFRFKVLLIGEHPELTRMNNNFITERWLNERIKLSSLRVIERRHSYPHDWKSLRNEQSKAFGTPRAKMKFPISYIIANKMLRIKPRFFARFFIYKCQSM